MNKLDVKAKDNKSQSVAQEVFQQQSSGESTFQFVDNRPEAVEQRKLQGMGSKSPRVKQAAQFQAMANNYSARQQQPIQKKENNTSLLDNLKTGIESLSGYSMADVKVHYNSDKPAQLQAHAYAQGTDIHLGPGQEKHLPHEAWHVVQQKQGRVKPTMQLNGKVNINDDPALESEADVMGKKAATHRSPNSFCTLQEKSVRNAVGPRSVSVTQPKLNQASSPVQRHPIWRDNLAAVIGGRTVSELENKVGQPALKLYNDFLQPRVLRSVIRGHSAVRLQGPIMHLRAAIDANTPALNIQDVNFMISQALNAGWAHTDIAILIATVNARNYGDWAHVLINLAGSAGWTATETNTLINTGHTAAGQLEVLAASAAGRGWSAADLTGAIAASNAQGINNWGAMDVAINEAEVSAAELIGSFAIQNRFNAGNARVGGRTGANVPHAACTTQVYNYPAIPAPVQAPVRIYFAQGDLDHYNSGHSYPDFALTRGNIRRAPASTLFPLGSNIPALANASMVAAGNAVPVPANGVYAGNQCMFHQMDPQNVRMDMCYPTGGDVVTKGTLLSVKAYIQP